MPDLPAESDRPILLRGAVLDWPASTLWQGKAGLHRLAKVAGSKAVQVLSSSTPHHHGSLHKRSSLTCPFSEFLSTAEQPDRDVPEYLYLAQSAIQGADAPLSALLEDILIPDCLQNQQISDINLWMCTRGSRSSLHYDPYENLLCVVRGCKTVDLYPPAATPLLYPQPLWGEAANHSSVDHEKPDACDARYPQALKQRQQAIVQAGDALYIPQGWWHQVDSTDITIAVNFWWQSPAVSAAQGPAAAFLLRESLRTLTQAHMTRLLAAVQPVEGLLAAALASASGQPANGLAHSQQQQRSTASSSQQGTALERDAQKVGLSAGAKRKHDAVSGSSEMLLHQHASGLTDPGNAAADATGSSHLPAMGLHISHRKPDEISPSPASHTDGVLPPLAPALVAVLQQLLECSDLQLFRPEGHSSSHRPSTEALQQSCVTAVAVQQAASAGAGAAAQAEQRFGMSPLEADASSKAMDRADRRPARGLAACAARLLAELCVLPPFQTAGDPMGLQAPATRLLASLTAAEAMAALQALADGWPQACRALLSTHLPPAAAELLTRYFEDEKADLAGLPLSKAELFEQLYGLFDKPELLLEPLVAGKEAFAQHAYCKVVEEHICV